MTHDLIPNLENSPMSKPLDVKLYHWFKSYRCVNIAVCRKQSVDL